MEKKHRLRKMNVNDNSKCILMSFLKFNPLKLIYVIPKYTKETRIKENECIWQIKTNSNVISEI